MERPPWTAASRPVSWNYALACDLPPVITFCLPLMTITKNNFKSYQLANDIQISKYLQLALASSPLGCRHLHPSTYSASIFLWTANEMGFQTWCGQSRTLVESSLLEAVFQLFLNRPTPTSFSTLNNISTQTFTQFLKPKSQNLFFFPLPYSQVQTILKSLPFLPPKHVLNQSSLPKPTAICITPAVTYSLSASTLCTLKSLFLTEAKIIF